MIAQSSIYASVSVEIDQQQYHQKNNEIANRFWGHGVKVKCCYIIQERVNNFNPYLRVILMNIVKPLALITYLLLLINTGLSAQTTWRKAYGAFADEECSAVRKIGTNEFIAVGSTGSFGNGSADIYVVRLGNLGEMVWSRAVGNAGIEHANDAIVTVDDFIYLAATPIVPCGGYDGYLLSWIVLEVFFGKEPMVEVIGIFLMM